MTDTLSMLRKAGEAVSYGPWASGGSVVTEDGYGIMAQCFSKRGRAYRTADAAFIALARNSWDAMLAVMSAAAILSDHYGGEARESDLDALREALAQLDEAVNPDPKGRSP